MLIRRPYRHLLRYRQVVTVLARHGFGYLIDQLGLGELLPFGRLLFHRNGAHHRATQPEHFRLALEELGATFIKFGQILSTRADLLPADYIAELSKLQESVPPVPFAALRTVIEEDLGAPLTTLFARVDSAPIASASIGQVHAATLPGGEEVVIKVQKPGVHQQIVTDLEIMHDLARLAARRTPYGELYDLQALVDEFSWTLLQELDYDREGRNADRFRQIFENDPRLYIPKIYWRYSSHRVIVLERISGLRLDDVHGLDAAGIDRRALARRSAGVILKEVFDEGFFHADPHPGNFYVFSDGTIGAMDFGMVGRLDARLRDQLFRLMQAILARDAARMVDVMDEIGMVRPEVARPKLHRELFHLLEKYYDRALGDLDATEIIADFFTTARRNHLQFPSELALLLKTVAMNEGLGRQLEPAFNMVEEATPYVRQAALRRLLPTTWAGGAIQTVEDLARLSADLPGRLDRLLRLVERGELMVSTHSLERERMLDAANSLVNRLSLSVLAGAFIVGLALTLQLYRPPGFNLLVGWMFAAGFALVVLLGMYLLYSMLRSGRH